MLQVLNGHAWWPCFAIAWLVSPNPVAQALQPSLSASAEKDDEIATVRKLLRESRQLVSGESYELVQAIGLAQAKAADADLALQTMKSVKDPRQIDVGLRRLAVVLAERGDSEGAVRILKMIKDEKDGYAAQEPIAWQEMGNAYAGAGKKQLAAAAYAEAVRAFAEKSGGWLAAEDLSRVAEAQFRLGEQVAAKQTFQKAIECALAEKDRSLSLIGLGEVAEAQARTGAAAEALQSLRLMKDECEIDYGTGNVAVIQARRGEFKEAQQTVSRIKRAGTAARSWLEIARVQAQRKEHASATESLATAIRKGGETKDVEWAIEFAQDVASFQAEIGDKKGSQATFEQALRILDKEAVRHREFAYRKLAVAMGKAGFRELSGETFKKSLKLAGVNDLGIKDKELQDVFKTAAISVIAKAQAEAGVVPEAIQTAKMIGDEFQRELTISDIGEQQARRGDLRGALATAELLGDKRLKDWVNYAVATAELDRGQWQAALKRGLSMEDSYWKALVLQRAGRAQARSDLDGAMAWCTQQKSAEVRARALLGVAEGVLDRRQQEVKAKRGKVE
jgi:tetratricopeptide (TPR) repeat protein